MKKKICIVTATRAEYGLLKNVIKHFKENDFFEVKIAVTGMHLSPEFGYTYKEIENDGYIIDEKIEILMSSDTSVSISKSMGLAIISFAEYFEKSNPDLVIVLGDRYEILAVCCAAMNARIPIAHLHGGETTEGAIDECIRHSITKMSYLHFTSTETYRKRVIQLGEDPSRVFNVGALGVENILHMKFLTKKQIEDSIKFKLDKPYIVITYHPVTLEDGSVEEKFRQVLKALDKYKKNMKYIFTKANADTNGRIINKMIDDYVLKNKNSIAFESLGSSRYLNVLKYSYIVLGNSSSGIIEAPVFKVPTINIGDRQKGRIQGNTIINCRTEYKEICKAIEKIHNVKFQNMLNESINIYGNGNTSLKIIDIIEKFLKSDKINLKKKFYDIY